MNTELKHGEKDAIYAIAKIGLSYMLSDAHDAELTLEDKWNKFVGEKLSYENICEIVSKKESTTLEIKAVEF